VKKCSNYQSYQRNVVSATAASFFLLSMISFFTFYFFKEKIMQNLDHHEIHSGTQA